MRRFSFLDRLTGDKNKNNSQQSDFDKKMAAIRSGDAESVECNETFTDDNIADICLAVQASETVTAFRIRNVSIEPSIEFVASLCSTTRRLTELRLSNAGINEHESNCLIAALLTNKSVRLLAVDHNNITSAEQWAQLLRINKTIESLDLSFNHLCTVKGSDATMEMIGSALVGNMKLRDLYIAGNGIQDSSVRKFVKMVRENGDDMGLRSLDLVNDSTLPTNLRDELSSVMARPAAKINGLKKARDAEDVDQSEQQQTTAATSKKQPIIEEKQQQPATINTENSATRGANLVTTATTLTTTSPAKNHDSDDDVSAVSNSSMSNLDKESLDNQSFASGGGGGGGDAAARAAKLQKLQQMKAKHQADLAKKDQTEKELRENISDLQSLVEKLKKDVAVAQDATRAAVQEQQQQAAAALAAAVATASQNSDSSTQQQQQQLAAAFEEKERQNQKQIQKLTSLLDEMAKKHTEEMDRQDQKLLQQQRAHQDKYEQLSSVVATLTAENEQGDIQIASIKKDMDSAKSNFDKEIERMKKIYQEKEKELASKYDQDRQEYIANSKLLQSQFEAANERADALVRANQKLEKEATQKISSLRSQLQVAITSSTSPIAGFFENNNNNNHLAVNSNNTTVKIDAIAQTEPLPSFSSRANNSGSVNNAPPIPSMDISSVTRFKLPENGIPRPSSDDSFVGDSDDDDEGNHVQNGGGQGSLPGGKPKYLPKNKWIPDEKVAECRSCKNKFGMFLRKHHCRMCGHVFCDDCAPVNKFDKQRVCHMCASSQHSSLFVS